MQVVALTHQTKDQTRRHQMHQKHYPKLSAMNLEITSLIQHKTDIWREHLKKQWDYKKNMYTIKNHTWPRQQKAYPNT